MKNTCLKSFVRKHYVFEFFFIQLFKINISLNCSLNTNFIIGLGVFTIGLIINLKSDNILLALKRENKGYQIPKGFMFEYITSPNYFGEILEWIGFAIMTWCLPGFIFALWTVCNLFPRAISHHKWYQRKFIHYPEDRKAIIPFIL